MDRYEDIKNEMIMVVSLQDEERGSIEVRRDRHSGCFVTWIEMEDINGRFWERAEVHQSLSDAMDSLAKVIKINVENDFYGDQDGGLDE